jgi:GxxExxY protein
MNANQSGLKHGELTEKILGAFYEVYNELGCGFLEAVYENALSIALTAAGVKIERQVPIPVWFRKTQVGDYRADIVVEKVVIVEIKATRALDVTHEAQLLNYLRATSIEIGLLLNFGSRPQFKRLVFDNSRKLNLR